MAGRPPKPTALHIIDGTYRKPRHGKRRVLPADGIGAPPEWFTDEARSAWDEMQRDLPWLSAAHRPAAIQRAYLIGKMIATFAGKLQGKAKITVKEQSLLHSLNMQFGGTPASMAKVPPTDKPAEGNRFEAFKSA